jgi:hypothetical protein
MRRVGVRWTIGDVSDNGWQALRLAIVGAQRVFGPQARYAVCVNSVTLDRARAQLGSVSGDVDWLAVSGDDIPADIRARFDDDMAEGVAWKLAPLRMFPECWEISLDNDCILWNMPPAMQEWLDRGELRQCLLAEDASALYGSFAPFCGSSPRNAGIRGLPPGYPLHAALRGLLEHVHGTLSSELDEQGLQVAAVSAHFPAAVVSIEDVTICSPFPPHRKELGRCGAHFCGLNARHFPWQLEGRYAEEWIDEHWRGHLPEVNARVAAPPPDGSDRGWDGATGDGLTAADNLRRDP